MSIILSPTRGQKRQTVINGPSTFAANSYEGTLISATGLVATANTLSTPAIISFAAGFGPRGAIDHIVQRKALDTVALAPNAVNYLYYERNPSTGIISFGAAQGGSSNYAPFPPNVANGVIWFSTVNFVMQRYNGAAWVPLQRVYVGEVATNASAPTKIITYAYNGLYMSPPRAIVGSANYTFEHNLGMPLLQTLITVFGIGNSSTGGASIQHDQFTFNSSSYGYLGQGPTANTYVISTAVNPVIGSAIGLWETGGTYWLRAERAF
jgi:hypothetical protein